MSQLKKRFAAGVVATACCWLGGDAWAQAQQAPKSGSAPPTIAPTARMSSGDAARKAQILASDRWRRALNEFHQWLSVQVVNTPQQVEQMKARLAREVQSMSADELEQFLNQWEARLNTLLGQDATEARNWLGQYMSAMASGFRKQFLQSLGPTDVTNMTSAQIEARVNEIRNQRLSIQQQSATSNTMRQQMVQGQLQSNAAAQRAAEQAAAAARSSASQFRSFQTPYSPRPFENVPVGERMNFWVDGSSGRITYSLP